MTSLRSLVFGIWLAGACACSKVEVVGSSPDVPLGEGAAAGEQQGGSGSSAGEGAGGDGGTGSLEGGAPGAIDVALWPTYSRGASNDDSQALMAAVSALSAGSAALPLHVSWSELSTSNGQPRAAAWQRLDALTKPYRDRDGSIALCIDIVDRTRPAWPVGEQLEPALALPVIERTVDEVFTRYGGHLVLVCFGYEVDRYLATVDEQRRGQLLQVLEHAVEYAREHEQRGRAAIGVAMTLDALGRGRKQFDSFRLGDQVVAVYDPLAGGELKPPGAIASEIGEAIQTIEQRDPAPRPLALLEVGYPTSSALASSQSEQLAHLEALLDALDSARGRVDFVGLYGLDDRDAGDCEAEATLFGTPPEASIEEAEAWLDKRAAARCSMGLRAESGAPESKKAAWSKALAALARYSP